MKSREVKQLLRQVVESKKVKEAIVQRLSIYLPEDCDYVKVAGVSTGTALEVAWQRVQLLRQIHPLLKSFCQPQFEQESVRLETLWNLWLPLALRLADQQRTVGRSLIKGVLGGQGTGKTTLGHILSRILEVLGYRTLGFSLDDLYKTHAERLQLHERDPRLIWRGPPGTHDIELGIQVLDTIQQATVGQSIAVPRFDKSLHQGSGDRVAPEVVKDIDIVLFEGWFVGAHPVDPVCFDNAPEPINTELDRRFARDMNCCLQTYLPLWKRLDGLIVLHPTDYRLSKEWRKQAERAMRASGKPGMSDDEVDAFVEYFWKALHPELFITPLMKQAHATDLVIEIDEHHLPRAVSWRR